MGIKLTDIQNAAQKRHPHLELDFELVDKEGKVEEVSLTIYNLLRTKEEERVAIGKEFEAIMNEKMNAQEKKAKQTARRVLTDRMVSALRSLASDKDAFDQLIQSLDRTSTDFDITVDQLYVAYAEETSLGEALASDNS